MAEGNFGTLLRSTNGGASWTVLAGADHVRALGGNGSTLVAVSENVVLESTDFALTWSARSSVSDHGLAAVSMPNARTVVAVGGGVIVRGRR
jgi:hypothetical protein